MRAQSTNWEKNGYTQNEELMPSNCGAGEDLRVPWTARRSNQSFLKKINHEYSLEGLMLKLKLQDFGHLMQRANSLVKILMLGKIEGRRRRREERMRWLDSMTNSGHQSEQTMGDCEGHGSLTCCSLQGCRFGWDLGTAQQ